jgi:hypothetical protein
LSLTYVPPILLATSRRLTIAGSQRTLAFLPSAAHTQFAEAKLFALNKHKDIAKDEYFIQLSTWISVVRYLLNQGLAFRGHDESQESDITREFSRVDNTFGKAK